MPNPIEPKKLKRGPPLPRDAWVRVSVLAIDQVRVDPNSVCDARAIDEAIERYHRTGLPPGVQIDETYRLITGLDQLEAARRLGLNQVVALMTVRR